MFSLKRVIIPMAAIAVAVVVAQGSALTGSAQVPTAASVSNAPSPETKPGTSESSVHSWAAAQGKLAKVSDAVQELLDPADNGHPRDPSGAESGYARLVIDPRKGTFSLYWKGTVPAEVTKILEASELPGNVYAVDISLADLNRANEVALNAVSELRLSKDVWVSTVAKNAEWTGVIATIHDPSHLVSSNQLAMLPVVAGPASIQWVVSKGAESGDELQGQANRNADVYPWWGGSASNWIPTDASAPGRNFCTTGAPIQIEASGNEYLLGAYHCAFFGHVRFYSGSLDTFAPIPLGTWQLKSSWIRPNYDSLLIPTAGDGVATDIYTGPWNSSTHVNPTVSWKAPIGAIVCQEGARFGEHCGQITDKNFYTTLDDTGESLDSAVAVRSLTTGMFSGSGDSGAPVLGDVGGEVRFAGVLVGGYSDSVCETDRAPYPPVPGCSHVSVYIGAYNILTSYGAHLK